MDTETTLRKVNHQQEANRRLLQMVLFVTLLWVTMNLLVLLVALGWLP